MKESAKTPESFMKWLEEGPRRCPSLYSGELKHKAAPEVPEARKAVSVATRPIGEAMAKERLDWAQKAAGEEVEWDANQEGL